MARNPNNPRKPQYVWTQEAHDLAVKMWAEGATSNDIAKKLKVSNRVVQHHASQYRHKFPWRRSARRPGADHKKLALELCSKEYGLLAQAAVQQKVPIAAVVRNALALAKEQGYPIKHPEIMLGPAEAPPLKARRRFVDKTKPPQLIPYAGAET